MLSVSHKANFSGHRSAVYSLAWQPILPFFYSADGEGFIVKWDINNTELGVLIARVPASIFVISIFKEGTLMAVGTMQGAIYFIDIVNNLLLSTVWNLSASIFDIQQNNNLLWVACANGSIVIIDIFSLKVINTIKISSSRLRSICFYENFAAIGCGNGHILQLDTLTFKLINTLQQHTNSVFTLTFDTKRQRLISGGRDAHLAVWSMESYLNPKLQHFIPAHNFTINKIIQSQSGSYLITASRDKTIKIWNADNFLLLKVMDKSKLGLENMHTHSVNSLLWLTHFDGLISAGDDKQIYLWEIKE